MIFFILWDFFMLDAKAISAYYGYATGSSPCAIWGWAGGVKRVVVQVCPAGLSRVEGYLLIGGMRDCEEKFGANIGI
jgi:hypothetical protein